MAAQSLSSNNFMRLEEALETVASQNSRWEEIPEVSLDFDRVKEGILVLSVKKTKYNWIIGIDQELKRGKMSMFLTATVPRFSEFQQNPQITYLLGAKFFHSTPKPQLKLQLDAIGGLLHVSIICNDDNVNKYCKSKWIFVTESLTLPEDKHGFLAEFATRLAPEISAIREGLQQLANFDSRRKEWDPTTVQEALTLLGDFKDLSKDKAFGALYWFMKCLEIATSQQDFVNCNELFHSVHHKVFD